MKNLTAHELAAVTGAGDDDPLTMPPGWTPDFGNDAQALLDALAAQAQAEQEQAWRDFLATQQQ